MRTPLVKGVGVLGRDMAAVAESASEGLRPFASDGVRKSEGGLRVLDLFSGIGGFSLGLERAGMKTVAFCEIEDFPRQVLAKHWPGVPIYDDVCTLTGERLAADGHAIDLICGGFPCQDVSESGSRAGITGKKSGLWFQYGRLVREVRPRFVVVENVTGLLYRGLGEVLGDLAASGYDAQWRAVPASTVGLPQTRDRVWIVAYPRSRGTQSRRPTAVGTTGLFRMG